MTRRMPNPKSSRRNVWPLAMIGAGLLLVMVVMSVVLWSQPAPQQVPSATPPIEHSAEETFPEIPRVSLAKAKTALDAKSAVFVDVRDASSYAAGHIPGALSIPLARLQERLGELNRSAWIITYCT